MITDLEIADHIVKLSATLTALQKALQIIPPARMEMLADWLDGLDHGCVYYNNGTEMQDDLRRMAGAARAALATAEAMHRHLDPLLLKALPLLLTPPAPPARPARPARRSRISKGGAQ